MKKIEYLADHPEHINTVAEWIYDQWTDKNKKTLSDVIESFKKRCKKDEIPLTLIALSDSTCVGTVTLYENDLETRKDLKPWLGSLYVESSYRRQGIGGKLTQKSIDVTRQLGFNKLYLRTEDKADYYSKRGWDFVSYAHDEKGVKTQVFKYQL